MTTPESIGPATAATIERLAIAANAARQIDTAHFLVLPHGHQQVDISAMVEKTQPAPNRKRGTVTLHSIESLLTYATDQAAAGMGYIYADVDARGITLVFNDNKSEASAGWRDHRAHFVAELTPEARKWLEHNGAKNAFSQTEFAEFIEDNIADLAGNESTNLLSVATTIQASSGINFSSAKRLQDGQTQLVYNESINATAGADGKLQIPQFFDLGLRLFKGDQAGYKLRARLKYRLVNPGVKFWYELERPERAIEDAFSGYIEKARASGYTVLLGKPGAC